MGPILFTVFQPPLPLQLNCMQVMTSYTQFYLAATLWIMSPTVTVKPLSCIKLGYDLERPFQPTKSHPSRKLLSQSTGRAASPVLLEGEPITHVTQHKHLGVILTYDLSWSYHLDAVFSKGTQRAGHLKIMSRILAPSVISSLYLHYVRPCLEYANPLWHGATPCSNSNGA